MRSLWFGFVFLAVATACCEANGAMFVVTSTRDAVDISPGDGVCKISGGGCSLRAAVQEANAIPGADSIVVPRGVFELTLSGPTEDSAATGDLDVTDDLVINGAAKNLTTIDGYSNDRIFDVKTTASLTISDVTISGGQPAPMESGGAILNNGTLTVTNVLFSGNRGGRAPGSDGSFGDEAGDGGALENLGTATLLHVTFSRNSTGGANQGVAAGSGGAMQNDGSATMVDVTFDSNQAGDGAGRDQAHEGGSGGALVNNGVATISDSLFTNNSAGNGGFTGTGGLGGGIFNFGMLSLTNVTLKNNTAGNGGSNEEEDAGYGGGGGGLENWGDATLVNVRFTQNHAGAGGNPGRFYGSGGDGGDGGGMEDQGTSTLDQVTFDGNHAGTSGRIAEQGGSGGGLSSQYVSPILTNVTFVGNYAGNGVGAYYGGRTVAGSGGGISGYAVLNNVTLALNHAGSGSFKGMDGEGDNLDSCLDATNTIIYGLGHNCVYPLVSHGHNLDSGTTCGLAADGDLSNANPALASLSDNGGFAPTLALLPNSQALDAGDNASCATIDERGVHRPQGSICDIGAYEVEQAAVNASATPSPMPTPTPAPAPGSATPGGAPTPTPTNQPSALPTLVACVGDCDGDGVLVVTELVELVNIALGSTPLSACAAGDANADAAITIDEILVAEGVLLNGCSAN